MNSTTSTVILGHDSTGENSQEARLYLASLLGQYGTITVEALDATACWTRPDNGVQVPESVDLWVLVHDEAMLDSLETQLEDYSRLYCGGSPIGLISSEPDAATWVAP